MARRAARIGMVAVAVVSALVLAGCTSDTDVDDEPDSALSSPATDAAGSDEPPQLVPGGTAEENQPYFTSVLRATLAEDGKQNGRDFVDALVEAGFDKSAMEITEDRTSVDLEADSIQLSILIDGECIIAQLNGPGGYRSRILPVLSTGTCLIGKTRAIDW